jgi:3',5'-cyclic AMP phosphodiesterase CpdA
MPTRKLIHLSDIHIGREEYEATRFQRVIASVSKHYQGTPVLITGDLTDSATKHQMLHARKLLDELAQTNPVLVVPGNHDYAWKGNILRKDGWQNWVDILGAPLGWKRKGVKWMTEQISTAKLEGLGIWPDSDLVYFGVDSGDPSAEEISARGFISKKLAEALKVQLDKRAKKTRIVLLHHHPFDDTYLTALEGSELLLDALAGRCELLLFGHEHRLGIWWKWGDESGGIPLVYSSHKTTNTVFGDHLAIAVIEIRRAGTKYAKFWHRLELV